MWAAVGLFVSAAVVAYILIGYPLLLALLGGRTDRPVRKDLAFRPRVTVIMAVYNGAPFLRRKIESILALDYPKDRMQILIVSDGSTDASDAIASEYADRGIELIAGRHRGKAACLNLAFARATGEILFFTDVRQLLQPKALLHLASNFADPSVGAVTGEMQLLPAHSGEQRDMDLYWKYELWVRRRHSQIDSTFTTTGCIYALRREFGLALPPDTLSDDAVLSLKAFFSGSRVVVEADAIAFDYPAVSGTEFRRRWRNLAGLWQVHMRFPQLFTWANRMRWHFLSHKFARLVLPWATLALVGCTIELEASGLKTILLVDEALFLGVALVDPWLPKWFPLKRLSSPARTFLLMNMASLAGIAVFFVPAQKFWKPTEPALAGFSEKRKRSYTLIP